jgi:predicted NUDIX family NTP pyrophosphohydrolase
VTAQKRKSRLVSAGLLAWRRRADAEFLLGHPGGPYWKKKDDGAWSIPKGLVEPGHDLEATARREFLEETGLAIAGDLVALSPVTSAGGKILHAFAVEADLDLSAFASNSFSIEWPPRSGRMAEFPEIDRIGYFSYDEALKKINKYQRPLIEEMQALIERGRRA